MNHGGKTYGFTVSYGLRPVFTLNSEIKVTEGDGKDVPYTLVR